MECNFCEKNGVIGVQDTEELLEMITDILEDSDLEAVSVIADEDVTKELLYHAVNDDYEIDMIDLDRYEYDDAYITTINKDHEFSIEKALSQKDIYLATDDFTLIQFDLPCKCDYIEDVMNNKYIEGFDPEFFIIGEFVEEGDCDEEEGYYTYANDYDDEDSHCEIFVSSTEKDFVDVIKDLFEEVYC